MTTKHSMAEHSKVKHNKGCVADLGCNLVRLLDYADWLLSKKSSCLGQRLLTSELGTSCARETLTVASKGAHALFICIAMLAIVRGNGNYGNCSDMRLQNAIAWCRLRAHDGASD